MDKERKSIVCCYKNITEHLHSGYCITDGTDYLNTCVTTTCCLPFKMIGCLPCHIAACMNSFANYYMT